MRNLRRALAGAGTKFETDVPFGIDRNTTWTQNRRLRSVRPMEALSMKRFIHLENLRHFRELLAHTTSEAECKRIVGLIEEEDLNYRASADDHTRGSETLDSGVNARRPARR